MHEVLYQMVSRGLISFFFQEEDGIRDLVRSRGLGDVNKRQGQTVVSDAPTHTHPHTHTHTHTHISHHNLPQNM